MKYVLANDRTPFRQVSCLLCCEPISNTYLRNIATPPCYCDTECYTLHCSGAVALPEKRAQSS